MRLFQRLFPTFALVSGIVCVVATQQPARQGDTGQPPGPRFAAPTPRLPLIFREEWRQPGAFDAGSDFDPSFPVTPKAVTHSDLELKIYDPNAPRIPEYRKTPPPGSIPRDWIGTSCVILAGYNQNPPPEKVVHGEPSDPPNLWTGVCGPVAVTLRHTRSYVDLTGLARLRWVTRVSGFHVVRPVVKLADGTFLVGDHTTGADRPGAGAGPSTDFLESELSFGTVRWLRLDITRVVTRGTWVDKPDLSRVDEVGFADLMPGTGHGWGGFVNVGRIEVYGKPVLRTAPAVF
ncbi:MAG: hypothetical protein HY701_00490 [Gemmatimonadetes bacterium]|nr:hypothetical protein [Gemmatimonadota bacterium]